MISEGYSRGSLSAVDGFLANIMSMEHEINLAGSDGREAIDEFPAVRRFLKLCTTLDGGEADFAGRLDAMLDMKRFAPKKIISDQSSDEESPSLSSTDLGESFTRETTPAHSADDNSAYSHSALGRATPFLTPTQEAISSHDVCPGTNSLVVCDWDDTLLPTSWLCLHGLLESGSDLASEQREVLEQLAASARKTLEMAKSIGRVVLITNASPGWVEMSCAMFMPSLSFLLHEFEIVYARSDFDSQAPDQPAEWKRLAFERELKLFHAQLESGQEQNIVCMGDAFYEHAALSYATYGLQGCKTKSLKFKRDPTIMQLIDQHRFLFACFSDIAHHEGNLSIDVSTGRREDRQISLQSLVSMCTALP